MSRVSFYTRPYDRLEPYDGKLSRTVLRGGAGSNTSLLPDIHSEKDILKLVTTLIANTKGDGKAGDEFWTKAETLLYCALIGYIHYEAPVEEQNFSTLIEFLNAMEVREDDEEFQNPVDLMFEALEKKKPNHFAVRQYKKYKLAAGQTTPPKHFTEDLLLHAMETASADSMPEGVERQGIGTPATRAATIEKLVQKGFLERKGNKKTKVLLPTDKGKALVTVMPEEIQSPEMTADWETKLLQIERGEMEPGEFMTEINTMITELVKNTEMKKGVNALMKNKIIGVCPNCGANVVEREKGWFCESNPCRFVLWKDNAFFKRLGKRLDAHVADKLLRDGRVRLKDCKSAKGKTYNATVLLSCEADGRSKFSLEFEGGC